MKITTLNCIIPFIFTKLFTNFATASTHKIAYERGNFVRYAVAKSAAY